jgi:hypothetical protein
MFLALMISIGNYRLGRLSVLLLGLMFDKVEVAQKHNEGVLENFRCELLIIRLHGPRWHGDI